MGKKSETKGTVCCMCGAAMSIDLGKLPGTVSRGICNKCFKGGTKGKK